MALLKQLDDTPLKFGKYKDQTPSQIAEHNPGYIVWMYENIEQKHCTQKLYQKCLNAKLTEARAYIYTDYEYPEDDIGDGSWSGRGWGD